MVANGQIDFLPRTGKRGGAYCASAIAQPTFIISNYTGDVNSLSTIAHEMGHAFHAYLSKDQKPVYEHAPISACEVASTFFENFLLDELFSSLGTRDQLTLLCERVEDDLVTIFTQIACFNYERRLHERVRKEGSITASEMAREWIEHISPFFGPVFKLKELDGYRFVRWVHLRYFFYTYTYAYGQLVSKAMYGRYKKDPPFLKKVEQFLSAGGSKKPDDIFRDIGIDPGLTRLLGRGAQRDRVRHREARKTGEKVIVSRHEFSSDTLQVPGIFPEARTCCHPIRLAGDRR
jgi:oligoendopeptidase F